jgi:hypothetical protein
MPFEKPIPYARGIVTPVDSAPYVYKAYEKSFPLNDNTLGPVSLDCQYSVIQDNLYGSIGGETVLPLQNGAAEVLPECGWKDIITLEKNLTDAKKTYKIGLSFKRDFKLAEYTSLVLKKKPVKLKVTLVPESVPETNSPGYEPSVDEALITIPDVKQPEIIVEMEEAKRTAGENVSFAVRATVQNIPPNVDEGDRKVLIEAISVELTDQTNIFCKARRPSLENSWMRMEIEAPSDSQKQMKTASVTVDVAVKLSGIDLKKSCIFSIPVEKTYVLNLDTNALEVNPEKSGTFAAWVIDKISEDATTPIPDASISVVVPSDAADFLSISPQSATGTLKCTVIQKKTAPIKEVTLIVDASVGKDTIPPGQGNTVSVGLVTIPVDSKYALIFDKNAIQVDLNKSVTFSAWVIDKASQSGRDPVIDASLSVDVPLNAVVFLSVTSQSDCGILTCTVSQIKTAPVKEVILTINASVGKDAVPHGQGNTVSVGLLVQQPVGLLEVEFEPGSKNSINPFFGKDTVTIKARIRPAEGAEAGALASSSQPNIKFKLEKEGGWLDQPYLSGSCPAGWACVSLEASNPDRDSLAMKNPPSFENVIVTATVDGKEAETKTVSIHLLSRPGISADKTAINFLANAQNKRGKGEAKTEEEIILTVENPTDASWTIDMKLEGSDSNLIAIGLKKEGPSSSVYTLSIKDPIPEPEDRIGQYKYEQVVRVKTTGTCGPVQISGPDILVTISHEGLFVEKIFIVNELGEYKYDPGTKVVTIRGDDPDIPANRVARVKFVAMVWDGEKVVEDTNMTSSDNLKYSEPKSNNPLAKTILGWKDLVIEPIQDPDPFLSGTWSFKIKRFVPGNGQKLPATIEASCQVGTVTLPLEIVIAEPDKKKLTTREERDRTVWFIGQCIPRDHPKYTDLVHDLIEFGKIRGGAADYRGYRKYINETAQKIWVEDQQDYLTWKPWEGIIGTLLDGTKKTGDFAFIIVIGYYTRSFTAQQFAPIIKDEAINFFNYYVDSYAKGQDDVLGVFLEYFKKQWKILGEGLVVAGVDAYIMEHFDPKKPDPKIVALMFAWKFAYHKSRDKTPENEPISWWEAFVVASEDIASLALILIFQEFVNTHGDTKLRELVDSVKAKGLFGGKVPGKKKTDAEEATDEAAAKKKLADETVNAKTLDPVIKKSLETVRKMQESTPNECLVIHDKNGNEIARAEGVSDSKVVYPKGNYKDMHSTHTHPLSGKEQGGAHSSDDIGIT